MSAMIAQFPDVPVMALTATADEQIKMHIANVLGLDEPVDVTTKINNRKKFQYLTNPPIKK